MTLLCDPLFRTGWCDAWNGEDSQVQSCWEQSERAAYRAGRGFAFFVQDAGETRLPLTRGALPNPEAQALLVLAHRAGALTGLEERGVA